MDSKIELANDIVSRIMAGTDPEKIFEEVSYTKAYVDEVLIEVYGVSLSKISKKMDLSKAYELWSKNGFPPICRRNQIKGIKDFGRKFYESFGFTLDDAQKSKLDPDDLNTYVAHLAGYVKLKRDGLIKTYILNSDGHVTIEFNPENSLEHFLTARVYILPVSEAIKQSYSLDSLLNAIIQYTYSINNNIKALDFQSESERLIYYDLSSPIQIDSYLIYRYPLSDEFAQEFNKKIENKRFLRRLKPTFDNQTCLPSKISKDVFEKMNMLSTKSRLTITDKKEIWNLAKIGLIKLKTD